MLFMYTCTVGALRVGDEIVEICGISVQGRTVDFLQKMLVSKLLFIRHSVFYLVFIEKYVKTHLQRVHGNGIMACM